MLTPLLLSRVESLRPPNEHQTKETKGRKSNKKKKTEEHAGDKRDDEVLVVDTADGPSPRPKRTTKKKPQVAYDQSDGLEGGIESEEEYVEPAEQRRRKKVRL